MQKCLHQFCWYFLVNISSQILVNSLKKIFGSHKIFHKFWWVNFGQFPQFKIKFTNFGEKLSAKSLENIVTNFGESFITQSHANFFDSRKKSPKLVKIQQKNHQKMKMGSFLGYAKICAEVVWEGSAGVSLYLYQFIPSLAFSTLSLQYVICDMLRYAIC